MVDPTQQQYERLRCIKDEVTFRLRVRYRSFRLFIEVLHDKDFLSQA
jgi:hypothetical protein